MTSTPIERGSGQAEASPSTTGYSGLSDDAMLELADRCEIRADWPGSVPADVAEAIGITDAERVGYDAGRAEAVEKMVEALEGLWSSFFDDALPTFASPIVMVAAPPEELLDEVSLERAAALRAARSGWSGGGVTRSGCPET